jgi:hypothetical protein
VLPITFIVLSYHGLAAVGVHSIDGRELPRTGDPSGRRPRSSWTRAAWAAPGVITLLRNVGLQIPAALLVLADQRFGPASRPVMAR